MIASHPTGFTSELIPIRPATLADIRAILGLHSQAFADKFGAAFGARSIERGIAAMERAWQRQGPLALRGMYLAELDGLVVGTITLRTWEMSTDDTTSAELAFQQALGIWGATRSIFVLSLLDHTIDRYEGWITDVAVLVEYRRRGIARALLAHVEHEASLRRKRFLGLYVSARNQGARRLYARAGFYERRLRRSLLARLILGQGTWVYMRKDLA